MKKYLALVLALILGLTVCGCSSETEGVDGGFVRETYSGIIKEQLTENGSEYIRVVTGNNEVMDFLITGTTEIDGEENISEGDSVEIDCVHWYEPSTYEILKLTVLEANDWGISLSVKNIAPTGATLVISQFGGNPSGELRYGSAYKIQSLNGDTWEDVPYVTEADVAWTDEAYMIEMDIDCEIVLSWDWLYGNLPEGQYRIVKEFMDFRSSGDYDKENYYADFDIK